MYYTYRGARGFAVGLVLILLGACAGSNNEQIAGVALSGAGYANEIPKVYDYAFAQALKQDTADLILNRADIRAAGLSASPLIDTYSERHKLFTERAALFSQMKRHSEILRDYFVALNSLADDKAADSAGSAADGLASSLGTMFSDIGKLSIGGTLVTSLVKPLTTLAVSSFVNAKLQDHLTANATTVQKAIGLQGDMFVLLQDFETKRIEADLGTALQVEMAQLGKDLPADWARRRQQLYAFQLAGNPATVALEASRELQQNFKTVVEGGQGALDRLERSIVVIGTVVDIFKATQ